MSPIDCGIQVNYVNDEYNPGREEMRDQWISHVKREVFHLQTRYKYTLTCSPLSFPICALPSCTGRSNSVQIPHQHRTPHHHDSDNAVLCGSGRGGSLWGTYARPRARYVFWTSGTSVTTFDPFDLFVDCRLTLGG